MVFELINFYILLKVFYQTKSSILSENHTIAPVGTVQKF